MPLRESAGSSVVQIGVTLDCLMSPRAEIHIRLSKTLVTRAHAISSICLMQNSNRNISAAQMAPVEERIADSFAEYLIAEISPCPETCM